MMQFLGIVLVILLIACIFSKKLRMAVLKFLIVILCIWIILYALLTNPIIIRNVICVVLLVCGVVAFFSHIYNKHMVRLWLHQSCPHFTENQLSNLFRSYINQLTQEDKNATKFNCERMPLGRANAFLNYFNKTIDFEEPIYFSPLRSKIELELREYGFIFTLGGIYISKQLDSKDKDKNYNCQLFDISFKNMWLSQYDENRLTLKYKDLHSVVITQESTTVPLKIIHAICQEVISSKISLALTNGFVSIYNPTTSYEQQLNEFFDSQAKKDFAARAAQIGGTLGSTPHFHHEYSQIKHNMDGIRGNGYAAEYANNTVDRAIGKNVDYTASNLDNGRQVKNGADRTVNHINIQTKYYSNASDSIGAAFSNNKAKYLNSDGSMMQIEVPRDQYEQALSLMQKRIDKGEVPGAKPGDDPKTYVRKGWITYQQSFNVAQSGTIESLTIDALNGAVCCTCSGGMTTIFVFATQIWNGTSPSEAAKNALLAGAKTIGKGTVIYTITMQLSRKKFSFVSLTGKSMTVDNPMYKLSEKLAQKISHSNFAKTKIGECVHLSATSGRAIISNGIIVILAFGPDICNALFGKISLQQLFKNSAITGAGIAGAAIGQVIIPVPFLGSFIGSCCTSFVAKKLLDNFIEDDAVEMYQILKEEFIDIVMLSGLNQNEFEQIIKLTLGHKKLSKFLRDMYACGDDARKYANSFISNAVIKVLSDRKIITDELFDSNMMVLAS